MSKFFEDVKKLVKKYKELYGDYVVYAGEYKEMLDNDLCDRLIKDIEKMSEEDKKDESVNDIKSSPYEILMNEINFDRVKNCGEYPIDIDEDITYDDLVHEVIDFLQRSLYCYYKRDNNEKI